MVIGEKWNTETGPRNHYMPSACTAKLVDHYWTEKLILLGLFGRGAFYYPIYIAQVAAPWDLPRENW